VSGRSNCLGRDLPPFPSVTIRIMFRAVSAVQLYPPIALAAVASFLWILVAYRLYKRDLVTGPKESPSLHDIWYVLPLVPTALYFWATGGLEAKSTTFIHIFFCTLCGIAFAILIVGAFQMAFYSRSLQKRTRVIIGAEGVFFLGLLVWSALA
ncbi:hypothetical protein, partial [Mesorhizobium sp. M1A.F.Ca.IN.022.07.1.1]|uniref:hypothetical protein n=1 Tax=Mesorhizobium sp. M1A.F.Ca.IN.022.07.1.1 TaxID=2496767 RepID=UPI0019CFA095